MAADADSDVPDSGAAFTYGRSRFSDNLPGKFWIRDDPILHVACGDEHTALLTASGRVFTFGNNEWGQLGHGHTKTLEKPTSVKSLRKERVTVVSCGRSHTLVATSEGRVYGFGANGEGQLGCIDGNSIQSRPVRVQGLEGVAIKMLSGGADHSLALTEKGAVYVWGSGSEGQLGLEKSECLVIPTELKLESHCICISAGYYHSAFVTVDGKLYTCGEGDSGKLGLPNEILRKAGGPHHVSGIRGKVVWASCGGNHTVALTADGKAYSFGNGYSGQLGLGTRLLEAPIPHQVNFSDNTKVARVSCGESHTAFLTDTGQLYTCGDGRHGKLGTGEDSTFSNKFFPTLVSRFRDFQVQQVACGGCHMLILAVRRESLAPSPMRKSSAGEEGSDTSLARERRRQKNSQLPHLSHTLPPSSLQGTKKDDPIILNKTMNRIKLPSISQGPVWYVPLEDNSTKNKDDDSDDEVLSHSEQRHSFLSGDDSMRHVDSDVESESSEIVDLNQTYTLIRIHQTDSIDQDVKLEYECSSSILPPPPPEDNGNEADAEDLYQVSETASCEPVIPEETVVFVKPAEDRTRENGINNDNVSPLLTETQVSETNTVAHTDDIPKSEDPARCAAEESHSDKNNVKGPDNMKTPHKRNSAEVGERRSHFYDNEDDDETPAKMSPSLSTKVSKSGKSSKACVVI